MNFKLIFLIFCLVWGSCTRKPVKPAPVGEVKIIRLDRQLFALDHENPDIYQLAGRDSAFLKIYFGGVLRLGKWEDPELPRFVSLFLRDTVIREVYDSVSREYPDLQHQEKELTGAFGRYKSYFPGCQLPRLYAYISGFNQSVVVDSNVLGVSLDNYLGEDCIFYKMLATPVPAYICRRMTAREMVRDILYGWLSAEYPFLPQQNDLLSGLIYQGKLIYLLEKILPAYAPERLFGYTPEQWKWCRDNEEGIWEFLVGNEYLFDKGQTVFRKYLNEAPYSSGMPAESPGRAVVWCGYRIIQEYVRKTGCDLNGLMGEQDYHKILRQAAYRP